MARKGALLSRDQIIAAALTLVDEQGLDALTMRRLANALNVEAMSLYNHVRDKGDLIHGMVLRVLSEIEQPEAALSWRETLDYFAHSIYRTFLAHPSLIPFIDDDEPYNVRVLAGLDRVLGALDESGLAPDEQVSAFRGLMAMCLGFVLSHTRGLRTTKAEAEAYWRQQDGSQFTESQLAHLMRLAPHFKAIHADDDFRFMLNAYLDALEARSARNT